jgi:hypothetical protein
MNKKNLRICVKCKARSCWRCHKKALITDEWLFNYEFELDTSDDKGGISRYRVIQDLDGGQYRLKIMLRPYEENYLVFVGNTWIGRIQYRVEVIKLWEAVMGVPWELEKI